MAEALVIGLITESAKGIIESVIGRASEEVRHAFNWAKDLKTLEIKIRRIHLLLCATSDSTSSSNPLFNDWLQKVKFVGYEADDLLDAFAYESLKRRLDIENASMKPKKVLLRCLTDYTIIKPRFRMSRRVRGLMDAIEGVFEDARVLGIKPVEITGSSGSSGHTNGISIADRELQVRRELVDGRCLIGRSSEEVKIVNMLCDSENLTRDLSVVAIVGMAGLGKTALCRRIFDENQVKECFEKRIWICVSHDFEVKGLLIKMIELVGGKVSNGCSHQAMLQELEKNLRGKRYLLVLDDAWDTFSNVWESLCSALLDIGGLKGTMILASSRSFEVVARMEVYQASAMTNQPFIHQLRGLNYNDSWLLFTQRLNHSIDGDSSLKAAASKMVIKCAGVPLAIKALADLLRFKSLDKWKEIEESEIWKLEDKNSILPSLKLSFNYLPSAAVKNCFAYCAIFPEDAVISRQHLIELWMAQGFLQPYDKMEEIGNNYFNILLNNSFFQDVKFDGYGNVTTCQMHDIVHALAKVVAGQECLVLKESTAIISNAYTVRHLSFLPEKEFSLKQMEKLRTLISSSLCIAKPRDLLRHAKCLRVLSLVNAGIRELPESIGGLKHLRYLDLSENYITVLPNSISRLYNLQTLRHESVLVWHWSEYPSFPAGLCKLVNLRHIYAYGFSCRGFSLRIQLESSESPSDRGGRKWGTRISDLRLLNNLSGSLAIWQLEHVLSREEAREACLGSKTHINQLELTWSYRATHITNCEEVLEELQPHMNLKELTIWYYKGKTSPSWLTSLCKLERLQIFYCRHLEKLPTSPVLPFLKVLVIWGCHKLTNFPEPKGLTSLEKLQIGRCPMLETLPSLEPLCNLRVLEIHNCGKMTSPPDGISHLSNLTTMELGPLCPDLDYFPFPRDLNQETPLCKSLLRLRLTGWPRVKDLPCQLQHLTGLNTISLFYFDSLVALPDWFGGFSYLHSLELKKVGLRNLPPYLLNVAVRSGSIRLPMD